MRKITADKIYTATDAVLEGEVIIVDEKTGKILSIEAASEHDQASLEHYRGAIVPGFVNTHCHLELSHMKGKVDTGTGLLPFLKSVVQFRDIPMEEILDAIDKADEEMYREGIVAVGDISNKVDTFARKEASSIRYYTFVEMFDFLQGDQAETHFQNYKEVYEQQSASGGNAKSCVPHAPYTVSPELFRMINQQNSRPGTVSIHNQETAAENELFRTKQGGFADWYASFGFPLDHFQASGSPSIFYALQHMDPAHRTLFVHNTMTTPRDIEAAKTWNDEVYWATCPNANLYIENRLPNYRYFLDTGAKVTIGTDSLTSNWQLSVLEEIKTIARYQSYVPLATLIQWGTRNGAQALGFEDELGTIEIGKCPGLNLLDLEEGSRLTVSTTVQRLI
jgi:cytosine/adenosine deaminase-related metal-dependent hydrolase